MRKGLLVAVIIVCAAVMPAAAETNGLYLGGSIGQTTLKVQDFGDEIGDFDFSDSDNGYKIFAGYRFLTFFAVEAGYVDFGKPKDTLDTGMGDVEAEIKLNGWDAFGMAMLPLGPVDIFGKLGLISWDADIRAAFEDITERESDSGTDPAYGLGAAFRLGSLAVRLEYELFDVKNSDDVHMVSLGVSYTF